MKKLLATALFLYSLVFLTPKLSAQEEAQNEDSAPTEEEATENLKTRLKESLEEAKISLISTPDENAPRAYVGTVVDLIQSNIEVKTKDGTRYAKTDDETTIIRTPGNTQIELEDIRIDDFIISMGYSENDSTILAKRVIVSQSIEPTLEKTTGKGTIIDFDKYSITIHNALGEETILNYYGSTIIKTPSSIEDEDYLEIGQEIIYTADINDDEYDSTIIMIVKENENQNKNLTTDDNNLE